MKRWFWTALLVASLPLTVYAQGTSVALKTQERDENAPVEIVADALAVDEEAGTALYTGDVVVTQNDMRLAAPWVLVTYDEATDEIRNVSAKNGVIMVTADEEAEGQTADYDIEAGVVVMKGDVLFTQGQNTLAGNEMVMDIDAGTINVVGRVRSVFQTEDQKN